METYIILAANPPTTIIGGQPGATTATTEVPAGTPAPAADGGFLGNMGNWVILYVVLIGGYIWFIMRNNKKK